MKYTGDINKGDIFVYETTMGPLREIKTAVYIRIDMPTIVQDEYHATLFRIEHEIDNNLVASRWTNDAIIVSRRALGLYKKFAGEDPNRERQEILEQINLALDTKDREWFYELTAKMAKLKEEATWK